MITVVNKRFFKGEGIYIGRPSVLGNPFPMKSESERNSVIKKYEEWIWGEWDKGFVNKIRKEIYRIKELSKKQDINLICWCKPKACHGDIIKEIVEFLERNNRLNKIW